jgi:hypothetical protein
MLNENMYKIVIIPENRKYSHEDMDLKAYPPKKSIIFHNSSVEHVTVIATDTTTGNAVEVMIRKDAIPDWIMMEKQPK